MRAAARVLGIVGGLLGLVAAAFVLASIGAAGVSGALATAFTVAGAVGVVVSLVGITGAVLAIDRPTPAGGLMIAAAVVGFVFLTLLYVPAGLLLLIGGIMAVVARGPQYAPGVAPETTPEAAPHEAGPHEAGERRAERVIPAEPEAFGEPQPQGQAQPHEEPAAEEEEQPQPQQEPEAHRQSGP